MSEPVDDAVTAMERAAADLLPALSERLRRHGLGEIEIRHGTLRLRVAAPLGAADPGGAAPRPEAVPRVPAAHATSSSPEADGIHAPAVGFFVYADGLGPGLAVEKGDSLGWVEMLGVRHDVRAPRRGTVRHLVAESGEPVEYGQVVLELGAAEATR
jgi:acetyl-CoA carboxylase biotin carboxyl carrier protein